MPDLLDMLRVQDPPPQELRPGFGIPRPGVDGVAEIDSMGRPFERSTLIRGPHQLASNDPLQAEAEIAARLRPGTALAEWTSPNVAAGQREDIWGGVLAEDRPAALQESLLAPFQMGLQAGMRALKPIAAKAPQSRNVGGSLVERNDLTGEWEVKFSGTPKMDEGTKARARLLEREITSGLRANENPMNRYDASFVQKNDEAIARKRLELEALWNQNQLAPLYLVDPMSIPSGAPTSSMTPPMPGGPVPGTQVPAMPPTQRRRLRYSPSTGTLE